jgi:hypothetical protein
MGRLVFYPVAIGLFVLLDMALRARTGTEPTRQKHPGT